MKTKKDILDELYIVNDELLSMIDERIRETAKTEPDMKVSTLLSDIYTELVDEGDPTYKKLKNLLFFYMHNN